MYVCVCVYILYMPYTYHLSHFQPVKYLVSPPSIYFPSLLPIWQWRLFGSTIPSFRAESKMQSLVLQLISKYTILISPMGIGDDS